MSLMGLFSSIQSQSSDIAPPTTTEKTNWLNGTGNVDNTATARRNVKSLLAAQLGVDEAEIILTANIIDDLGADSLDRSELGNTFDTGFPKIDWANYTTRLGGLSSWALYLEVYSLVGDICDVWADAENKGKILVS